MILTLLSHIHTLGYPMPLPIVRLVLICKAMDFAHKATEFAGIFTLLGGRSLHRIPEPFVHLVLVQDFAK